MARIDIEIEDYLDEVDTQSLINELKSRKSFNDVFQITNKTNSKTPQRDLIIEILNLHQSATVEDIQEKVKEIYYK